jgi:DNA-directed RNA polymerase subunit RPC12/RpoP
MEAQCSTCGGVLQSPWKFCPFCGTAGVQGIENHENRVKAETEKPEKAPAKGAFAGLLFGMIAVPILVIVGTMLCLTGLGAILGVPMILAAVLAPLLGPMIGLDALKGKCPSCGTSVSSVANARDFDCHACGKRIAIKHREFVSAV